MERPGHVPLLVIGAGPYALSTAAHVKRHGVEPLVVGEPMGFWRQNMPERMLLRSGTDWHLDADGIDTFQAFLGRRGIDPADVDPIPLATFVDYADWFCAQTGIEPRPTLVSSLEKADGRFLAGFDDGRRLTADAVVAAPGIARFPVIPEWVAGVLPETRWSHTSALVRFEQLRGARVLIVGGRQSAFEWAALLAEAGAGREGRLKLEPWLPPRLPEAVVRSRPRTEVIRCAELPGGELEAELSDGERLTVDHLVLATGYKPDLTNVPYLQRLLDSIETADGFPQLDDHFQTSVPGLFMPGFVATRDFGPFFGFVRGCPAAATFGAALAS